MFEEATLTAGSVVAARHPETGEWVALEPCDLLDPQLQTQLNELAAQYAAAPAAGVLAFDTGELPTGPELATALAAFDARPADGWDLVEAAAGWGRVAAWAAAKEADALAKLAARPELRPVTTGYRSVNPVTNTAVEVAGRCQLTAKQAENQVGHAIQLVVDFPDTWAALLAGSIDVRRVRVITDELGGQDPAIRARVEAAVLPKAPFLDSVALRKLIKRLLHELAPVDTAERHQIARDGRYVAVTPASDGMAFLEASLPAVDAVALNTVLNAAADTLKRDDAAAGVPVRTRDQCRADALSTLGWTALATGRIGGTDSGCDDTNHAAGTGGNGNGKGSGVGGGSADHAAGTGGSGNQAGGGGSGRRGPVRLAGEHGMPVTVHVTFSLAALMGLSDEPGELDGYGPIPAHVARELAAHGVWRWLRTDPATGQVLYHGRTKYRPPKALAEFITARDRTCRAPGCHRPAYRCDLDHRVPFEQGGTTSAENCHCLCRTHHLLKHHGGWTVQREPDGTTVWTSPTGHRYVRPPEAIGPIAELRSSA